MADVRAFLATRAATPLPPAVVSLLDDVADRAQRFVAATPCGSDLPV